MTNPSANGWFLKHNIKPHAKLRLFCLPYAGSGATIFRPWLNRFSDLEIIPVQYPGRENRIREPLLKNILGLANLLAENIYCDKPFALFGHSMGALLAFELAHRLRALNKMAPEWLFLSASCHPSFRKKVKQSYLLSDKELVEELSTLNGTPRQVLENEELMQLVLPIIRADFEAVQTYKPSSSLPLDIPITVFGGYQDNEITEESLEGWQVETRKSFNRKMFTGDHFFIHTQEVIVLDEIHKQLQDLL
ncbi:MAG: thioesterase [Blastocatellia bacterium]|nr:thioesterase [Blastocatellia bacterium]